MEASEPEHGQAFSLPATRYAADLIPSLSLLLEFRLKRNKFLVNSIV